MAFYAACSACRRKCCGDSSVDDASVVDLANNSSEEEIVALIPGAAGQTVTTVTADSTVTSTALVCPEVTGRNDRISNMPRYACAVCARDFGSMRALEQHQRDVGHDHFGMNKGSTTTVIIVDDSTRNQYQAHCCGRRAGHGPAPQVYYVGTARRYRRNHHPYISNRSRGCCYGWYFDSSDCLCCYSYGGCDNICADSCDACCDGFGSGVPCCVKPCDACSPGGGSCNCDSDCIDKFSILCFQFFFTFFRRILPFLNLRGIL